MKTLLEIYADGKGRVIKKKMTKLTHELRENENELNKISELQQLSFI